MRAYKLFALGLMLISLVGCEKSSQQNEEKPIVVIISPDNPPYESKETSSTGEEIVGFDVDLIKEVAQRLGRPLEIIEADFGALIPSLQSQRADMAISALTPSDERRKNVDFSDPYYTNKPALLVLSSSPLTSEKDLAGQKLGVQLGTTLEVIGKNWTKHIPGLTLVSLNKVGELVQELKNQRVQAVLVDEKAAPNIAQSTPGLKVVPLDLPGGEIAIAFPKGSPLVGPVNEALKDMGSFIQELEKKWLSL